mgnify:CR=1 FL=1
MTILFYIIRYFNIVIDVFYLIIKLWINYEEEERRRGEKLCKKKKER